jgi:CxxC motif-containing protein (DUF1111 family)
MNCRSPLLSGGLLALVCACDGAGPDLGGPSAGEGGEAATAAGTSGHSGDTGGLATAGVAGVANGGSAGTAAVAGAGGTPAAAGAGGQPNHLLPNCDDSVVPEGLAPLFLAIDAVNPAIVSVRPDGVIVTRAAGRARNRHEKEGTFATYTANYFDGRTFGLVIEDFTATGVDRIRVTYLPIASLGDGVSINWRAWKVFGENATFQYNKELPVVTEQDNPPEALDVPHAAVMQIEETTAPLDRSFALGENFEFEFGHFVDPEVSQLRNSYYTDTFRYQMGVGGLTPNNTDYEPAPGPALTARLGGDTTIAWLYDDLEQYFGQLALNTQPENVQNFVEGRRLFHTDFVTGEHSDLGNQSFTEHSNQAGPLFATTACSNCHLHNGAGTTVDTFSESTSMEFKLYNSGGLGSQLQLQEGTASSTSTETKDVMLGDGTVVTLHKPTIQVTANSGNVGGYSARVAPKLIGLGLLEAIPESTVISRVDSLDCDFDGISGRASYLQDAQTGDMRLGRFGWKAEVASVEQQAALSTAEDLGVGNSLVPDSAGNLELSDDELSDLVTYLRLIGVPPQRNAEDAQVMQGEQLFDTVGCAACHLSEVVTGPEHPFAELRNQNIRPFTDLLLHDMGADLADDSGVLPGASLSAPPDAQEWRTPPLWGLGLAATVNPNARFLHDGRAANLLEAILWHGGEATLALDNFKALTASERDALLAFLGSL